MIHLCLDDSNMSLCTKNFFLKVNLELYEEFNFVLKHLLDDEDYYLYQNQYGTSSCKNYKIFIKKLFFLILIDINFISRIFVNHRLRIIIRRILNYPIIIIIFL